ncbi:MAG TPA: gamma-glutamylcyclotransferase family protein [Longimicrobium sp.]|nr:gamma-glutamylcyclotransferase family protein [Longimicrobium sp.]
MPQRLFVYGTLRASQANPMARLLRGHADLLGEGTTRARLHDLGEYPGAVASPDAADRVHGDVFALREPHADEVLAALDAYEGEAFERTEVEVALDSGAEVACWTYLFTGSVEGRPRIASGDYLHP